MTTLMAIQTKELDETDLARQAVHDVEAFAELYRRNLPRVYRYHMAHVGNARDAEDLSSQTFMPALEGIQHGMVDLIVERKDLRHTLASLLKMLRVDQ